MPKKTVFQRIQVPPSSIQNKYASIERNERQPLKNSSVEKKPSTKANIHKNFLSVPRKSPNISKSPFRNPVTPVKKKALNETAGSQSPQSFLMSNLSIVYKRNISRAMQNDSGCCHGAYRCIACLLGEPVQHVHAGAFDL